MIIDAQKFKDIALRKMLEGEDMQSIAELLSNKARNGHFLVTVGLPHEAERTYDIIAALTAMQYKVKELPGCIDKPDLTIGEGKDLYMITCF